MFLENKTGATRLGFALLLKAFQLEGRFPRRSKDIPNGVVQFVAEHIAVMPHIYADVDWSERTLRYHKAQIRTLLGFREFTLADADPLVAWLSHRVMQLDPQSENVKFLAYERLRTLKLEPPSAARLARLLRSAVAQCEAKIFETVYAHISVETQNTLDTLISTDGDLELDEAQHVLFPMRSDLATLKDDAGAVKVETVIEEIAKLKRIRALNLPLDLFHNVPAKFVTQYRQRAAGEKPRELRRHPPAVRYTLLAALCWQRHQEITDNLVELLIHIAHRIRVRAEEKVDTELLKYAKRVVGKTTLLYKLAKAATQQPDGVIKEVIFPIVGKQVLDDVIREAEADESYERQIRFVTRASYSHHYRRIIPELLDVLSFRCNNDLHRPVMDALAVIQRYRGRKSPVFPQQEHVPLRGVVKEAWHDLVFDQKYVGRVNRISYEICVITALREKVRCKEMWVEGAGRFRNPDEDLPQDFDRRRDEYYAALNQPQGAAFFIEELSTRLRTALDRR